MNPTQELWTEHTSPEPRGYVETVASGAARRRVVAASRQGEQRPVSPATAAAPGGYPHPVLIDQFQHDAMRSARCLSLMLWITGIELVFVVISVWCWCST